MSENKLGALAGEGSATQGGFAVDLDVRGLNCPLPILRTKKALAGMQTGEEIRVRATDPGSVIDFPAFCKHSGNVLVRHAEADGVFEFVLRRK